MSVMSMTDWKELVGKRILVAHKPLGHIFEIKVLDVSPSGKYVKIKWRGCEEPRWYDVKDFEFHYCVVEVLD